MPKKTLGYRLPTPLLMPVAAAFLVLTGNAAFFDRLTDLYPWGAGNAAFLISAGVVLWCAIVLLMSVLSVLIPLRIVVSLMILLAAPIGYFSDQYGVVIDTDMIRNMLQTDASEVRDLLTGGFILRFIAVGLIPVVFLWLPSIYSPGSRKREWITGAQSGVAALLVAGICLFSFSDAYAVFFRQHKPVRFYTNPAYALYSVGSLAIQNTVAASLSDVNLDGKITATAEAAEIYSDDHDHDHELIIVVVGETARSDRFSLNGYSRITNPRLASESGVVSYTKISSCGTSTAYSVPCMFSPLHRDEFSNSEASGMENVLDVLSRLGVSVLWRDNNSSSKGVADRVSYQDYRSADVNPVCDPECRDVGMLEGLQAYIDSQNKDILIVLHQMGSHGPAYFKRYPDEFELFTPACRTEDISKCSNEEIGNAYDNTIAYTDYFLSEVIQLLKANTPRFETAMLYVSDHGESLGESGLYLHGLPYAFAPKEQTEVPLIMWLGESSDVELASALDLSEQRNSHDALFNALLTLFEVANTPSDEGQPLFLLARHEVE